MAKFVAMGIGDVFPPFGVFVRCSLQHLMQWTNADEVTIRAAIEELVDTTEMRWEEREPGEFWFLLPIADKSNVPPPPPDTRRTFIYVVSRGAFTKIGISRNGGRQRMGTFQRMSPGETVVFHWEAFGPANEIRQVERWVHGNLAAYLILAEWFDVTPERAIEVVKAEMAEMGIDCAQ
jgi:hypothetical protein